MKCLFHFFNYYVMATVLAIALQGCDPPHETIVEILIENNNPISLYCESNISFNNYSITYNVFEVNPYSKAIIFRSKREYGTLRDIDASYFCNNQDSAYFTIYADTNKEQQLKKWLCKDIDVDGKQFFNLKCHKKEIIVKGKGNSKEEELLRYTFIIAPEDIAQ